MIGSKVVVTTAHRGVFFGELSSRDEATVILKGARNCLYWDSSVRGFIGLSTAGPSGKSRVGPACDEIELMNVTSISRCSDDAIKCWESAPWDG